MKNLSFTYRLMKFVGLDFSEQEYGDITFGKAAQRVTRGFFRALLLKYCMYGVLLGSLNYRRVRPILWNWMGASVGKNTFIGYSVWMDYNNAEMITLEDTVHVANCCILLCHKRDLSDYCIGDESSKLPYIKAGITLKMGSHVGMGSIIMPGVTIGEGAIIGSGSVVIRDIPAWTIAVGNPARVIRTISAREVVVENLS